MGQIEKKKKKTRGDQKKENEGQKVVEIVL
jgi:hypothetical protein